VTPIQTAACGGLFPRRDDSSDLRGIIEQERKSESGKRLNRRTTRSERRCDKGRGFCPWVAGANALLALAFGVSAEDGKAGFEKRQDTMKRMGRPFYLGIGRVVKGTAAYSPDTVTAAETVASLASTLDWTLFPRGSDVAESKIKPEIFSAKEKVDQLIVTVKTATAQLVPAVKTGDKAAIGTAYAAVNDACNACHKEFRKEE
jgi:cytochrome c556